MLGDLKNRSSWFVAGLGLGALAGVLFAPKSGCETRKGIAAGMDQGVDHLTTLGRDIRDRANRIAELGKKRVRMAIDTAKGLRKRTA